MQLGVQVSLTVTVTGTDEVMAKLRRAPESVRNEVAAELYRQAEQVMGDSKENYVPVDHGVLRDSGFVEQPKIEAESISVRLGFGGVAKAYAIAVHEHLSEHSPFSWKKAEASGRPVKFSPPGRGPKYLERPLLAAVRRIKEAVMTAVGRGLKP